MTITFFGLAAGSIRKAPSRPASGFCMQVIGD
jgi:hypothetical protein